MRILPVIATREELVGNPSLTGEWELVFDKETGRAYIQNHTKPIAPFYHGTMPDEESMLALFEATRGCYPGDFCYRSDLGTVWTCNVNSGVFLSEWTELRPYDLTAYQGAAVADVDLSAAPDPTSVSSLTFSNPPTQAECEALRNAVASALTALNSVNTSVKGTVDTVLDRLRETGGNGLLADA